MGQDQGDAQVASGADARVSAHGVRLSQIHSSALLRRFYVPDPDGLMVFFAETAVGAPLDPW